MGGFRLGGRSALVTGAANGIGLETARRMLARGASVTMVDLEPEVESTAAKLGDRAFGIVADAADAGAMRTAVGNAAERFGALDVVVANAGIAPAPRPISSMDAEIFERVLEVNLLGVYRTVHAALPRIAAAHGQVVIVASIYAFANGVMASPYAASKAAVEQLGRALQVELAPHRAGATIVYPGFADTRMVREAFAGPLGADTQGVMPGFVSRRISAGLVADRLVAGLERRARRVFVPRWYGPISALRGALNPLLDAGLARDPRLAALVERAEAQASRSRTTSD